MAKINFECAKCGKEFDSEVGTITFPEDINKKLYFEKDIICPNCGKLDKEKDEVFLSEYGQTQVGEIFFDQEK
jgi:DNA-directed RNA polymerase subunit RPC12/RpoP